MTRLTWMSALLCLALLAAGCGSNRTYGGGFESTAECRDGYADLYGPDHAIPEECGGGRTPHTPSPGFQRFEFARAKELLAEWPLTSRSGYGNCFDDAATWTVDGQTYALNGRAKTLGYAAVDPIWNSEVSLGPLIDAIRELC